MNIQPTASLTLPTDPVGHSAVRNHGPAAERPSEAAIASNAASIVTESKAGTNPATNDDVKSAVSKVAAFMKQQSVTDLSFSVDDETNIRVVKVIDRTTQEIIRQIPSEEMLQMAQALDKLQGLLLKQKA